MINSQFITPTNNNNYRYAMTDVVRAILLVLPSYS